MPRILMFDQAGELVCPLLEEAGYEVLTTTNSHEALLILRTRSIDLLTLALGYRAHELSPRLAELFPDMSREMRAETQANPVMTGEEFLRLIKDDEDLRRVPVLLLTGFDRKACVKFFQEFGLDIDRDVDGYVQKGGRRCFEELFNGIEAVLKKHAKPTPPEHLRNRVLEKFRPPRQRKRIAPGGKVTVEFTGQEWADLGTAYQHTCDEEGWTELLQSSRADGAGWRAKWTLDEIDTVQTEVEMASEVTDDAKLEERFRGLSDKLHRILDEHDDRS